MRSCCAENNGHYKITAAGRTTSIREEPYQADIIKRYGVRAVVGKGGMGAKTLAGLKESGAVYLNAIGVRLNTTRAAWVLGVHLLEFGIPEAMWHIRVNDFPAISRWTRMETRSTPTSTSFGHYDGEAGRASVHVPSFGWHRQTRRLGGSA